MYTPSWMDVKFFETSLRSYFKNDAIQILGFSCKPAVPTGENYTTDVFRVSVTFAKNTNSKETKECLLLIIKSTRDGFLENFAEDMNLFHKEIDMFVNILPKMTEIYGEKYVFAANCIHAILKPQPIIVMEDMCPLGFKVHERRGGLDLQHTLQVLKKIAAFHASSFIMCEKNSSILNDMYTAGLYPEKEMASKWIKLGFQELTDATEHCKELQVYYNKLKKIPVNKIIERCLDSWKRKEGEFNVLNHGDMWVNNIMFSYDENGKVNNCKLIDFQLAVYGSPAVDLHYFFSTSLADDIRNNINYFLDFYYAHLLVTLTMLGYNLKSIPLRDEFLEDYKKRAFYGLTAAATVLPLVKAEGRKDASFEDLFKDDTKEGFRHHCYNNDVYKSAVSHLLPYYDKLGVFV